MPRPSILAIDKPAGARSTACVQAVRRVLGKKTKVGHAGTLDSTANGLLLILIEGATRLSDILMDMTKEYEAVVKLGRRTTTCDYEGEVISESSWAHVDAAQIDTVLPSFLGWKMQVPPNVSAVHVKGKRAHELTRNGQTPELHPRPVYVERIEMRGGIADNGTFSLRIRCGKGTYVRSIARDIGDTLSCGAHIAGLRRLSSGPFSAAEAMPFPTSNNPDHDAITRYSKPLDVIEEILPTYRVGCETMKKLSSGIGVSFTQTPKTRSDKLIGGSDDRVAFLNDSYLSIAELVRDVDDVTAQPTINIKLSDDGE